MANRLRGPYIEPMKFGIIASVTALVGSGLVALAACGTEDPSVFPDGGASNGGTASGSTSSSGAPGITTDGGTSGDGGGGDAGCGPNLTGIVRDFKAWKDGAGHPDFERYMGGGQKRMVLPQLGADFKPQYNPEPGEGSGNPVAPGAQKFITSPESFAQWYRDVPGTNQSFDFTLELIKSDAGTGVSTYANNKFFPIDGQGFGDEGQPHNYGFTFELHTEFKYNGGEVFSFTGDDDLWTYIHGKLAIDLGGVHSELSQSVALDDIAADFGLVKGETYPLDVFHAERHVVESNFRIDTSIEFTNCSQIVH